MADLSFTVVDVVPEKYAAAPNLFARVRIEEATGERVHALALRAQIRIEPQRRRYDDTEEQALLDLFGDRTRFADTLRPFAWLHASTVAQGFTGSTEIDLPLPCTYDFEVSGTTYLHALRDGEIPLLFLFSGTVFTRGATGFSVAQVPWDCEARFRLPVTVWRDLMETYFPGTEWLRMRRDTVEALARYRHVRGLTSWDDVVTTLLTQALAGERPVTLALARLAADAVLYEGYLLYPYRSTAAKNQVRWQFGVLGPPGAARAGFGEEADLAVDCLLRPGDDPDDGPASVTVHLRFLQLQRRQAERADPDGGFTAVAELRAGTAAWTTWDEAVEVDRDLGSFPLAELRRGVHLVVQVDGGEEIEDLPPGRLVRRRWPLSAMVTLGATADGPVLRLRVTVRNAGPRAADKDAALRTSLIGTHLLMAATGAPFVSVIDPPEDAREAAGRCVQHRCWPVLAGDGGPDGQTSDVVLAAPIILSDHPAVAPESAVAMFDSTEIDEILTLRVLTLTDEEKAQARATDPRAAAMIDRCEQLSPEELQRLHGIMRDPHGNARAIAPAGTPTGDAWWAAEAAAPVSPETDSVVVAGIRVQRGSRVLLQPSRRADAQDMFLAGQEALVSAVHVDLDGETHVAVTLVDDPAAELHDWYGRYLYFAPDELRPLAGAPIPDSADPHQREESPS